jgi:8-oxo-dGTP pyrophosphatase MutT (NUDIX family)
VRPGVEDMEIEKGVILAVFDEDGRALALKRKKNWEGWELPKGHLEKDDYRETVLIELEEEAGIDPELVDTIEDLDHTVEWEYSQDGNEFKKEYKGFLVKVSDVERVETSNNPDDEHEHGFFFRPRHVEEMLKYDNNKEVLRLAASKLD